MLTPTQFLMERGYPKTAAHCQAVAAKAAQIALAFGADEHQARLAGLLHDISAVIPNDQRVATALGWGLRCSRRTRLPDDHPPKVERAHGPTRL